MTASFCILYDPCVAKETPVARKALIIQGPDDPIYFIGYARINNGQKKNHGKFLCRKEQPVFPVLHSFVVRCADQTSEKTLTIGLVRTAVVIKRSLSPGFAGIPNPLFVADNTLMFFNDGKKTFLELVATVKES